MSFSGRKTSLMITGLTGAYLAACWTSAIFGQDAPTKTAAPDRFKPAGPRASLMGWHARAFDELLGGINKKDVECADAAWLLAELANVNSFHSEKADYKAWAEQLRDGASELAGTIRKRRDFDRAKALFSKLKDTCKRCHDAYKI